MKFGTCSAQVLAFFLDSHTSKYDLDDKKQLTWDMAEAMNLELRQLAATGCKVIQIEEPTLHFISCYYPEMTELIDFLVDCFNREIEGLDDVEVWIHTCWGNPNMQKVFSDESYANSIEIYLDRLKGDVWTIEATENDLKELPLFGPHRDSLKKKIAVGVVSHRTLQADFPEVVADRIRRALEYIPAEKLVLSTDCGFGRQGFNRHIAFYKSTAIPQGRNIVLEELGLEPRYVAAADEALAWDMLPDYEPLRSPEAAPLGMERQGRPGAPGLPCRAYAVVPPCTTKTEAPAVASSPLRPKTTMTWRPGASSLGGVPAISTLRPEPPAVAGTGAPSSQSPASSTGASARTRNRTCGCFSFVCPLGDRSSTATGSPSTSRQPPPCRLRAAAYVAYSLLPARVRSPAMAAIPQPLGVTSDRTTS